MGKWPATRAECWPIHHQILDLGRHLKRDMAWHDDRMSNTIELYCAERACSRVSVRRSEMKSPCLPACLLALISVSSQPASSFFGVFGEAFDRRNQDQVGDRGDCCRWSIFRCPSAVHCLGALGARAGLPYQVNDRLPPFAVCPVQLEGSATTPALLPFPPPPMRCWLRLPSFL